ncbi:MAG TPA: hypothetical protein VKT82_14710 [Ktedonobacterales bacterium]|nr:hypothetical protein [Ktedonobacterales bacterium]
MRTQYYVALFRRIEDDTPFATIPMLAKMPLSAMVFALHQLHITRVARVVVAWEEDEQADEHYETDYFNVIVGRTRLTYDRAVEVETAPDESEGQER